MSLRLQEAFGLRREESIKFRPSAADHIAIQSSWAKGGRDSPTCMDYGIAMRRFAMKR
jgi:hypothetical protein